MAAYLSSQMKAKREVLGHYVLEVRQSGIQVLPPDINSSMENFTAVGEVIRFGLGAVARMGHNTVMMILNERKNGKFTSLWDFMKRVDMSLMNKTVFENLIKAGALDEIHKNRAMLLNALPKYLEAIQSVNAEKKTSQLGLFEIDDGGDDDAVSAEPEIPEIPEFDEHTKLDYEKQVTGMYISGHPYETHQEELSPYTNCKIMDLNGWKSENIKPCVGGIIASIKEKTTKKGSNMCNLQLEDTEGSIDVVIFPKMWEELKGTLTVGDACVIEGKFDDRGQLLPDKIMMADDLNGKAKRYITLSVDAEECRNMNLKRFVAALNGSKGNSRVILELKGEGETFCVYLGGCNIDAERLNDSLSKVMPSGSFSVHCGAA